MKDLIKNTLKKGVVHFVSSELLNPTNPITVNLIGTGGTGSSMLMALARINSSLITLGHAGLQVFAFDGDKVEESNLGRQLFSPGELGLNKAVALINRVNRGFGFRWKAIPYYFDDSSASANITISCVDNVRSRKQIAAHLEENTYANANFHSPWYWMDCGNDKTTGQVVLATVGFIKQPNSKKYQPQGFLPMITAEYGHLLDVSELESETPSCSLAESLEKQDLFINTNIANIGASILWNMIRKGMLKHRGFFINLDNLRMQPIQIPQPCDKQP